MAAGSRSSEVQLRLLGPTVSMEPTELAALSPWFGPFLAHFVQETLRCGGEAIWAERAGRAEGLLLTDPGSGGASLFAVSAEASDALRDGRPVRFVFSERELGGPVEVYRLFHRRLSGTAPDHRFAHTVRAVEASDHAAVLSLMRAELGDVDDRWFHGLPTDREHGFLVEVAGEIAGAAWLLQAGRWGRLHSLAVRPRFRRLGIGRDLLFARLLWAARHGVAELLSEIADANGPSQAIAREGGMSAVGRLGLYRGPDASVHG